jgi:predicted Zn finger-like uncharacterized protein
VAVVLVLLVVFGVVGFLIGQSKGRADEGFALGLLLGPIGILIALFLKDKRRRCPHCQEPIAPTASVCPHCQRQLAEPPNATCLHCRKGFRVTEAALGHAVRCPHCGKLTPAQKPTSTAAVAGPPGRGSGRPGTTS